MNYQNKIDSIQKEIGKQSISKNHIQGAKMEKKNENEIIEEKDKTQKTEESDVLRAKEEAVSTIETSSAQKLLKVAITIDDAKTKNRIHILLNHLYGEGDIKKKLIEYLTDCVNRDFEKIRSEL